MDAYNNEHYQHTLAGLTPAEFYFYSITGVYPCDEYYGVRKEELLSVKELIAARRKTADAKAAKRRESYARKKATPLPGYFLQKIRWRYIFFAADVV